MWLTEKTKIILTINRKIGPNCQTHTDIGMGQANRIRIIMRYNKRTVVNYHVKHERWRDVTSESIQDEGTMENVIPHFLNR